MSTKIAETGRVRILVLGQAWRCEQQAVLAEIADDADRATDMWGRAAELRLEAGQDPALIPLARQHCRTTYHTWRQWA